MAITAQYIATLTIDGFLYDPVAEPISTETPTWMWWLGSRLRSMSRKQVLDRLAVALEHVKKEGISLQQGTPSKVWTLANKATTPNLLYMCASIGFQLTPEEERPEAPLGAAPAPDDNVNEPEETEE